MLQTGTQAESEKIADWDQPSALNRMGGEIDDLLTLINLYIIDMPSQIEKLQQAFAQNDLDAARRTAHTIKGVAANLSALKLQNLAEALESEIKFLLKEPSAGEKEPSAGETEPSAEKQKSSAGKQDALAPGNSELIKANKQVMQILSQYQSEHNIENQSAQEQLSNKQLKDMLQPLLVKIQQGDYIEPRELQKLSAGNYAENLWPMINQLLQQISQFDSGSALQSVNMILQKIDLVPADEARNA